MHPLIKFKGSTSGEFLDKYITKGAGILNAGGAGKHYDGYNTLCMDIVAKAGVDVVASIERIPSKYYNKFDAVVCVAVLQYTRVTMRAVTEMMRCLKPGCLIFIEVPFVQPYCKDTTDRKRFTHDELKSLFFDYEILESGPSITPGSAAYMHLVDIAGSATRSWQINWGLRQAAIWVLSPLRFIKTNNPSMTCGGVYLIARKVERRKYARDN